MNEIEEQSTEDEVKCQICGQNFRALGSHLMPAHGIDIFKYRRMFPDAPTISAATSRCMSEASLFNPEERGRKISQSMLGNANALGRIVSEETKQKISAANKGRLHTEEAKRVMSELAIERWKDPNYAKQVSEGCSKANKGRTFDEEFCRRVSEGKKGHPTSEETRQKISQSLTGRTASEETKQKISQSMKSHGVSEETRHLISENILKAFTPEVRQRMSQWHKGRELSEEIRKKISDSLALNSEERGRKISEALMGNTNARGHTLSEATRQRISEASSKANLGRTYSPETIKRMSEARRKLWKDPEYARSVFRAVNKRPNETELRLLDILDKHFPNEWKYVGDGRNEETWFGDRNPDFINANGKKQVIELFGTYWHDPVLFPDRPSEEELIAHYKKFGYDCTVIWEYDAWNEALVLRVLSGIMGIVEV